MFTDLATWTNKKLKRWRIFSNILVVSLSYVAPLITILIMCWATDRGGSYKIPITALIIGMFFIFGAVHFLKRSIKKISIFDNKSQTLKHCLELATSAIIPLILLIVSALFATWLKEEIDFYVSMIITVLIFYIAGKCVDKLVLAFLDDETYLRNRARENNAVAARADIVNGK